jgi:hypothetical protein
MPGSTMIEIVFYMFILSFIAFNMIKAGKNAIHQARVSETVNQIITVASGADTSITSDGRKTALGSLCVSNGQVVFTCASESDAAIIENKIKEHSTAYEIDVRGNCITVS